MGDDAVERRRAGRDDLPFRATQLSATLSGMGEMIEFGRGLYNAKRAALLSGVPVSTIHYWARHEVLRPSASPEPRTRTWTWGDLIALRAIHWLRSAKPGARATTMQEVRAALRALTDGGMEASDASELIAVTRAGRIFFDTSERLEDLSGQRAMRGILPVVRPFESGVDLLTPGEGLRILPGKLSGEPHLEDTRLATTTVFSLAERDFTSVQIAAMYPEVPARGIIAAIKMESTLVSSARERRAS